MMEDMDVDLDKEFLQDLKDLKILITDKDLLDQHKRCVFSTVCDWVIWMGRIEIRIESEEGCCKCPNVAWLLPLSQPSE